MEKITILLLLVIFCGSLSHAYDWRYDSKTQYYWAMDCDFVYNDIVQVNTSGENCSNECNKHPRCLVFTYNSARRICFLKDKKTSEPSYSPGNVCGYYKGTRK